MPVVVTCPACCQPCTVADQWIGASVACPCCGFALDQTIAELYGEPEADGGLHRQLSNPVWLVVAGGAAVALACVMLMLVSSLFNRIVEPVARRRDPPAVPQPRFQPASPAPSGGAAPSIAPIVQASADARTASSSSPRTSRNHASTRASGVSAGSPAPRMKRWKAAPGGRLGMKPEEPPPVIPAEWQTAVDPPSVPVTFDPERKYHIAFPGEANQTTLVRPDVCSPFAALRSGRGVNQDWDLWDLVEVRRISSIRNVMMGDSDYALSPDGRYLASTETFKKLIYIWDLRGKESVGILELEQDCSSIHGIFFAGNEQLSCIANMRGDAKWFVWKMPDGLPERTVELPDGVSRHAFALSPGGKYLAVIASGTPKALRVYETATGEVRGETFLPDSLGSGTNFDALAFSPDGEELAALDDGFAEARLACWNMESGELAASIDLQDSLRDRLGGSVGFSGRSLEWFPNRQRWLVSGRVIVDRSAKGAVVRLPQETGMDFADPRVILDDQTLLVATGGFKQRALKPYKIESEHVARGIDNFERGGRQIDQPLPPLTPPDYSEVIEVGGVAARWQVKPDPAPAPSGKLLAGPLDLKDGLGSIYFSRRDAGKALVVNTTSVPYDFRRTRSFGRQQQLHRLCLYDLLKGKHVKSTPLTYDAEFVAFSPEGNRIAARLSEGRDRIDVFEFQTEKHLVGWRPYPKEDTDEHRIPSSFGANRQQVTAAEFVDADHLLTKSLDHRLVLWRLPECKAVWTTQAHHFKLTPNHKYIALVNHSTVKLIETLSGEPQGEIEAQGGISALAIDASGKRLATYASVSANYRVQTWNLEDGVQVESFLLPKSASEVQWCGADHLLLDHRYLVSLRRGMVIWKYEGAGSVSANGTPDGRFWYTAFRPGVRAQSYSLNALELPDPIASLRLSALAPRRDLAVGPGTSISLKASLPPIPDRPTFVEDVRQSVIRKFAAHQVTVVDGQPVTLELSYTSGPTGRTLYGGNHMFGFFAKPPENAERITEMKVECLAKITRDGKTLWERKSIATTPTGNYDVKEGESLAPHAEKRLWQSSGTFFEHLDLPAEVLASGLDEGFGVSKLTRGAAVPVEASPSRPAGL
ncbi:MAG TPA: hypothetical protein VHC19_29130 [Pirellulales bacterium]|nr:hypothetical protein [Pirellulales bacterium]